MLPFLDLISRVLRLERWTRDLPATRNRAGAKRLEPVPQADERSAIVPVVALDGSSHVGCDACKIVRLQTDLDDAPLVTGVVELDLAGEAVERLETLDRVSLDTSPDRVAHNRVQVDKPAPSQQTVHVLLAGCVPAHEPFEGGWLVRRIVIHVNGRISVERAHDVGHDFVECGVLVSVSERPARGVAESLVGFHPAKAEQILAAAFA